MCTLFKYACALFIYLTDMYIQYVILIMHYIFFVVFLLIHLVSNCVHIVGGRLLLKCSTVGIGFNGAKTSCGIAQILGILLMNSYDF